MRLVTAWQDGPTELLSAELFNSTAVIGCSATPGYDRLWLAFFLAGRHTWVPGAGAFFFTALMLARRVSIRLTTRGDRRANLADLKSRNARRLCAARHSE